MSLAVAIALIVLITEFILWFGYSQIASLAYGIYLNVFEKERIQKQRKIKRDILNVKHDLTRTSSQDQFAKWAKLRRKLDSKMSELDKIIPLYHSYAPESLKQQGPLVIQWCTINIQKFTPIVVQWVNTNAKTLCNVIIEKAKPVAITKVPPSTNKASVASTSKEEDLINSTETKEDEKVLERG
ncbi:8910_t:CDS:2 [Funneliformis caledonium]|uniref:8910_t:CDS:1 n=1 Tax=Funneliformis caledonium TaxID=1117310 RepID=A0A9N8WFX9_9GLOM|nr:8910_t:CDS:2 [Funneliformis caledonium]